MNWILSFSFCFLLSNCLFAQNKKIVEKLDGVTVTYGVRMVGGENCPQIIDIKDDLPHRYIWLSYSPLSCDPMYGRRNEEIFKKVEIIEVLESYDCQKHCDACDCPSGTTYYFKLYRDDYEKYEAQLSHLLAFE